MWRVAWLFLLCWHHLASAQVSVRDDRATTTTWGAPPQRIVSLLPSLTESVCALGACARLVGTDRFSNDPASVVALPKLGGLEDAMIERIVALKPDVVLAAPSTRAIDRLEALGLKVVVLDSRSHSDVARSLRALGQLLAAPADAERVWARIERELDDAAGRVPAAIRGRHVYFEIGPTPYAAGPESFIGQTLARLGMGNAIPSELGPFPKLNPEYVVRSQPDIVMAAAPALTEMPRRPGWGALRALQRGQACGFTASRFEMLVRPGPRLGEAARTLADCLVTISSKLR